MGHYLVHMDIASTDKRAYVHGEYTYPPASPWLTSLHPDLPRFTLSHQDLPCLTLTYPASPCLTMTYPASPCLTWLTLTLHVSHELLCLTMSHITDPASHCVTKTYPASFCLTMTYPASNDLPCLTLSNHDLPYLNVTWWISNSE